MRIPRWTTYPAIALLLAIALIALPSRRHNDGAAQRSREAASKTEAAIDSSLSRQQGERSSLRDFLPDGFVLDGTVDYRGAVQAAIVACSGKTLELPEFPILIGRSPGERYGLIIREGLTITGSQASELKTHEYGLQLLRGEGVHDLTLSNFSLTGPGGDGERLGHGLLQITGGKGIHLENLHISAADADGLAIAQAEDCTVEGVSVTGASKSAIYLADCSDSFVRKNTVSDFGGHYLGDGVQVGVGIQLSSCRNVHCTDNLIQEGLGVGILCNAFQGGSKPMGVTLTGNKIRGVSNHDNRNVSGGIRLANGSGDKLTRTQVSGNSIWDCGENGIYIENHGGSEVTGNFLSASLGVGIQVSTIEDVRITNNVIFDSGVGRERPTEPFALINSSHGVHLEGNVTDSPGQVPATED